MLTPSEAPSSPLRNGDFLSRAEFERRYDAMPHLKKAELIEGMVYIPSPDFYPARGESATDGIAGLIQAACEAALSRDQLAR